MKDEILYKFLDLIQLYDVGLTKTRIGFQFDGGYVLLDELCKKRFSEGYSCGLG